MSRLKSIPWVLSLWLVIYAISFLPAPQAQERGLTTIDPETGRIIVHFPPNNLGEKSFIPKADDTKQREVFNTLINEISTPYVKLVNENEVFMTALYPPHEVFKVTFVINDKSRDWENTNVNANASQPRKYEPGKDFWSFQMYGALFRRPEITLDGFALVICHELGHHFAGFPFTIEGAQGLPQGLAAEGQADYFATQFCLRNHWRNANNAPPYQGPNGEVVTEDKIPKSVTLECQHKWNTIADQQLCQRIAIAGFSVATLWGVMARDTGNCESGPMAGLCKPDFDTPDPTLVRDTFLNDYPSPQCRLDTYFHGSLCTNEFGPLSRLIDIPGKFDFKPENSSRARDRSDERSCSLKLRDLKTIRPLCWSNPAWPTNE